MQNFIFISILLSLYGCTMLPGDKMIDGPTMPTLRTVILDMANEDQAVRKSQLNNTSPSVKSLKAISDIDNYNTDIAKDIYAKNGWPNSAMIGPDGVKAFWLLVQHSPDSKFQRSLLPSIDTAFAEGDIDAQNYALFVDRLLVKDGKPQKYGTQIKEWNNKTPIPFTIDNPSYVNSVRENIGLFSLEDYLLLMKDAYFPEEGLSSPFNNSTTGDNQGSIGLQLDVKGRGPIANMTLESLTVIELATGSPAAKAGLQLGDRIIEIDGVIVAGNNADRLMATMDKPAGDEITVVARRPDGTQRKITIVFIAK